MSRPKIKLTKRVVLGLAMFSTVGGLSAFALMRDQMFPEDPVADGVQDPDAKPEKPEKPESDQPTLVPADDVLPPGSLLASRQNDIDQNVLLATYEEGTPEQQPPSDKTLLPDPGTTILRANDGDAPTTATPPPAGDDGAGAGNDAGFVPPSPETDPPAPPTPASPPAEVLLEGPPAPITSAAPETGAAEVPSTLRDAARAAIGDSPAEASIYDTGPPAAVSAADVAPAPRFDASITDAPPADTSPESIYGTSAPTVAPVATPRDLPATELPTGSTRSPSPSFTPSSFGPAGTDTAQPFEGEGTPGANSLEGLQSPALTVEKTAPEEIQVGKEAEFQLKVRNVGSVAAHDVIVLDHVPRGTRFVNATPQSDRGPDGQLMWQLGTLQPGDETVISVQLLPTTEGELGSVAQVLFGAKASVRTMCTKPELTLSHTGPQRVMIGEAVTFDITVSNPGTGAATGVVLEENVPEGLTHVKGNGLTLDVGTLKPGETRRMQLMLKADKPGIIENVLIARGDGNLIAKDGVPLEVIAPSLEVALSGPGLRFLEREATYEVAVSNPGTAAAREVELVTYLPKGMKFVSADHKGQYEPQNHAVYWSLEELPPREMGVAKLTLLPLETGEQKLSVEGRAELGIQHSHEKLVQVDSLAELQFTIADVADPIEVGSETTYVITLSNTGSSAATNIRLGIGLPPSLKPVGGDGPTRVVVDGVQVAIDPLARLAPGEQAVYKLKVHGLDAGPQRIQVQLLTDETPIPVTKEEITRVYVDQ
jgi:uncharacterized repeat protein (TIGR01451 family)